MCCCATATIIGCDDYLDVLPDNRAALDSEEKITDLLVSAYPEASDYMLTELYSDNTDRRTGTGRSVSVPGTGCYLG